LSLLEEAKLLLSKYRIRPRRRLGQNFCVDSSLLQRMVEYCNVGKEDIVLEVGAGLGFLTSILADRAGEVLVVEVDPSLVKVLRERFDSRSNVRIIGGDVLDLPPLGFHKVVANPPYTISSELLTNLLEWKFDCAVLSLQREFAEKLMAHEGEENHGPLSVLARYRGRVEVLEHVPRNTFYPPPKVESAVVRITPQPPPFSLRDEEVFQELVRSLFTQRRRKARNALQHFLRGRVRATKRELPALLEGFPHLEERVADLKPSDFGDLANIAFNLVRGKRVEYGGLVFYVFPDVYEPSDDSFLLARHITLRPEQRVLDMGTGCGLLGILAASKGGRVTALDLSPFAVGCSRLNARVNGLSERFEARVSDLFQELGEERFDLIIFNPPYLPEEKGEVTGGWLEKAWQGGASGTEVAERFLKEVRNHLGVNGQVMMVLSSLSTPEKTVTGLEDQGFAVTILEKEKLDFEELVVLRAQTSQT
jgi:16S rRNA (adenine1518-N6/adenine1519-N6)-dimethyltransferase